MGLEKAVKGEQELMEKTRRCLLDFFFEGLVPATGSKSLSILSTSCFWSVQEKYHLKGMDCRETKCGHGREGAGAHVEFAILS